MAPHTPPHFPNHVVWGMCEVIDRHTNHRPFWTDHFEGCHTGSPRGSLNEQLLRFRMLLLYRRHKPANCNTQFLCLLRVSSTLFPTGMDESDHRWPFHSSGRCESKKNMILPSFPTAISLGTHTHCTHPCPPALMTWAVQGGGRYGPADCDELATGAFKDPIQASDQ